MVCIVARTHVCEACGRIGSWHLIRTISSTDGSQTQGARHKLSKQQCKVRQVQSCCTERGGSYVGKLWWLGTKLGWVGSKCQILAMCILYWLNCTAPKSHSVLWQGGCRGISTHIHESLIPAASRMAHLATCMLVIYLPSIGTHFAVHTSLHSLHLKAQRGAAHAVCLDELITGAGAAASVLLASVLLALAHMCFRLLS